MRAARLSLLRTGMALGGALMLADCAAFSPDGGMGPVATYATQELGKDVAAIRNEDDADAARAAVERLLKRPLTADAAVQIALLNNRRLQAAYNELAVAEADMVQASLPPNPTVLAAADRRLGRAGDRAPDHRRYPGAGDAAGALGHRGGPLSSGAVARHRGNRPRRGRNASRLVSHGRGQ